MKALFFTNLFLWSALVFLVSCSDPAKTSPEVLKSLNAEELRRLSDSLDKEIKSYQVKLSQTPLVREAVVKPGQGLYQVMKDIQVDHNNIARILTAISDSVEFVKLKVGDAFHVGLDPASKRVVRFRYSPNPALLHLLKEDASGTLQYSKVEKPTQLKLTRHIGHLQKGSSLDGSLREIGIPKRMIQVVNGVLMCKVSFSTQAQPGDEFEVLLEERFFQDSIWIEGKVLFARYSGRVAGQHEAFLYDDGDPKSTFNAHYTATGEALIFSGLRYPLDRLHITSPFGLRLHPVTGRYARHEGVDYSAPIGTPVYAVAEGVVIASGYDPYSGNKIAIRHADKSSSWYLHLNSRSVGAGSKVGGRQIIGRSGNTGRSTGPHLHFGFKDAGGRWINPLGKRMIATPKLEGTRFAKLQQQIAEIRKRIAETPVTGH